jgi:hypothetical protein
MERADCPDGLSAILEGIRETSRRPYAVRRVIMPAATIAGAIVISTMPRSRLNGRGIRGAAWQSSISTNHHGNGTQDIFYEDPDVLFVSIHAEPATIIHFLGVTRRSVARGRGDGTTLNLPLPRGTEIHEYGAALDQALIAIAAHQADLLVVSFGADTFVDDPISNLRLRQEDYSVIASRIAALNLPILVVMEGGYAVDALGHNVEAFLSGFFEMPA